MPAPRRDVMTALALLALPSCGWLGGDEPMPPPPPSLPAPPPSPTVVSLTLRAAPNLNAGPDAAGRPVELRILQLAALGRLLEADFFALDRDPAAALGEALLGEEKLTLSPGEVAVWQRRLEDGTRFVAVVAAFREVGASAWRGFAEAPASQTTLLEARLGASGVALGPVRL